MYFPPTEILKIAYFLQPWARRAHRNPQNYIFLPKVGSIYPIKTFIPQMMASYIQYFWEFLTIFENFDNFAKLDFDDFFKIILVDNAFTTQPENNNSEICPQRRLPSTSRDVEGRRRWGQISELLFSGCVVKALSTKIILKKSSKSNLAKLSKFSKIVKNSQKYWIYDAIIWGMNVFIGYMLPTFGRNM